MKVLITGSSGHLGEALARVILAEPGSDLVGLDIKPSPFTTVVGSVADKNCVADCMTGVDVVYHTATLHKPHVATHSKQAFVDTNISGTLTLLEAAVANDVSSFVFTSTTSVFGDAMRPAAGEPAAWVTEDTKPLPKNIYGVTKMAAEELCHLFHRKHGLSCVVLRTSRFFPEQDDDREKRENYLDANIKANEFLYRRADIEDVVNAHINAAERANGLGFGRYIVSATTPFLPEDMTQLNSDATKVVQRRVPEFDDVYQSLGWKMFKRIDRVYVNQAARKDLGWTPKFDFRYVLASCRAGEKPISEIAVAVGSKGYHDEVFSDGPYPVHE
ncbi:NAD(P)-dependent oxidoreductase [Exilibacterium tricleocarpae]|uniref:NAD(P)-dependent oxidoreductase n=1 Tax=Exilibacterium tricleocarpae TaxID=2591008 RepID=A0A545TLF9_9GAMM|nr:NAD(P)-dependent oxidoreductase [Exilibacterium tricleocarpae]TQV78062.1 NAD(P)-dependent oxidoreductase [Exilibacterium tricleocarpae]